MEISLTQVKKLQKVLGGGLLFLTHTVERQKLVLSTSGPGYNENKLLI